MSSIDHRIVEMVFNNAQFEKGIKSTIDSIQSLESTLKLDRMADGIEKVSSKFNVFGAIGFAAIQKLTEGAIDFGGKIAGAVLDPLVEGGKKRALNIEQAKFQFEGLGMDVEAAMAASLAAVKDTAFGLDEAAVVAAQFGATGMEAGEDMANALRGISGVAAMAGASYSDVGSIFTKVAGQGRLMGDDLNRLAARGINAAATLADQMGITEAEVRKMVSKGKIDFETFAFAMEKAFGEHATKANETYTGALSNMRAAISRIGASFAAVKFEKHRRIFNALTPVIDKVADALGPVTELYEQLSEVSAKNWEAFLGKLAEADWSKVTYGVQTLTDIFRVFKSLIISIVTPIKDAFKAVFDTENMFSDLVDTINKGLVAFKNWLRGLILSEEQSKKVQKAFEIFFKILKGGFNILTGTGKVLLSIAGWLWDVVKALGGLLTPVKEFFSELSKGDAWKAFTGWISDTGEAIKDLWNKGLDPAIAKLKEFVDMTGEFLGLKARSFAEGMNEAFDNLGGTFDKTKGKAQDFFGKLELQSEDGMTVGKKLKQFWDSVVNAIKSVWEFIQPAVSKIKEVLAPVGRWLKDFVKDLDMGMLLEIANTGVFAMFGKAMLNLSKGMGSLGGINMSGTLVNLGTGLSDALGGLTSHLKTMQTEVRAKAILTIAIAIGVLAASVIALSFINPDNLGSALLAITALMGAVTGGMIALSKVSTPKDQARIITLSIGLILMSTAVVILSSALKKLSSLSWDEIARGLVGLAGAMAVLIGGTAAINKVAGKMGSTGVQLILLATSAVILASAVKIFATMSWEDLAKGLAGFAGSLAIVVVSLRLLSTNAKSLLAASVAITMISGAMIIFAGAIALLGLIPTDVLIKGMIAVSAMMLLMVVSTKLMGGNLPQLVGAAVAISALAVALNLLIIPIAILGNMKLSTLATGIGAIAVLLAVLALAMRGMQSAIGGAVATIAIASALLILSLSLKILGSMDLAEIGKGLLAMAGAIAILGLAAAILAPVAPAMITIAGAVALLGVGLILVAASMGVFAIGLTMLGPAAAVAAGGIALLGKTAKDSLGYILPMIGLGAALIIFGAGALVAGAGAVVLGAGLVIIGAALAIISAVGVPGATALVTVVQKLSQIVGKVGELLLLGVAFTALGVGLTVVSAGLLLGAAALLALGAAVALSGGSVEEFLTLIEGLVEMIPLLMENIALGIVAFAETIGEYAPVIVEAGVTLVSNVIEGIVSLVPDIIEAGVLLITEFLAGIRELIPEVVETAVVLITELLGGIRDLIPEVVETAVVLVKELLQGIRKVFPDVVKTGKDLVLELVEGLVSLIPELVSAGLRLLTGILDGIANNIGDVVSSATDVAIAFIEAMGENSLKFIQAGADVIIDFLEGLAKTITEKGSDMRAAGREVAWAIADGLTFGLAGKARDIGNAALDMVKSGWNKVTGWLGINSPSKRFMEVGRWTGEGMAVGLTNSEKSVGSAAEGLAETAYDEVRWALMGIPDAIDDDFDVSPRITPVLDLSDVSRGAKDIDRMLDGEGLSTDVSSRNAKSISADSAGWGSGSDSGEGSGNTTYQFNQTNNSPKALSSAEIYRQTKNQISMLRGV